MIKCTSLTSDNIKKIARKIVEAFTQEEGSFELLPVDTVSKVFYYIIETC